MPGSKILNDLYVARHLGLINEFCHFSSAFEIRKHYKEVGESKAGPEDRTVKMMGGY